MLEELGAEEGGSLEIHLTLLQTREQEVKERPKEPARRLAKEKEQEQTESFDSFLASQPLNPRPRLIYQVK